MNMKLKTICIALALFSFSAYTFAKPATYSFSGFGGGLPSSATRVSASDDSDVPSKQKIIVEDDETEDTTTSDEPTVNKNKKGALIATYVILGAVVTAGIVVGAIYLSNESADCCSSATDNMMKGCGEGCSESCNKSMEDACDQSVQSACSSSSGNSTACNSSSSKSTVDCSSSSINAIVQGNVALIPVFIP